MTQASKAPLALAVLLVSSASAQALDARQVVDHYADIARAKYEDSLTTARALHDALETLVSDPSAEAHRAAKGAWIAARAPYQQSEVFRFGNLFVDQWEGKVNAWPLDEGLIDYVDLGHYGEESDENAFFLANVVASPTLRAAGRTIDARRITGELLRELHEIDEIEANVATGYHALEFLLWGQDLGGVGPGAGERPWTDFATDDRCTGGACDRRGAYLIAASELLLADLEEAVAAWSKGGEARVTLEDGAPEAGLRAILTGMGSLSYGEQAGERMQLGLMLNDPEEEHDCFSDNTHNSHYYAGLGVQNVFLGRYQRLDGSVLEGPSLAALLAETDPALADELDAKLKASMAALGHLKETADRGVMAYDQMLAEGNAEGAAIIQAAIDALIDQTRSIERTVAALGLDEIAFEGSDSIDDPEAVFR